MKKIQIIQQTTTKITDKPDADNGLVCNLSRPDSCPCCGKWNALHAHGHYCRFVNDVKIQVPRFRCKYCALDVSVLPSFAMPYRNKSVEATDKYFAASDEERRNLGSHDTLRHYWKAWERNWQSIRVTIGLSADCARTGWLGLRDRFGTLADAQVHLVSKYFRALLKRYVMHVCKIYDG